MQKVACEKQKKTYMHAYFLHRKIEVPVLAVYWSGAFRCAKDERHPQ